MTDLSLTMRISASGMRAQGERLRVIAENLANAQSTGMSPDELPYRRQTIGFHTVLDRVSGVTLVEATEARTDPGQFIRRHEPNHPAADAEGYVLYPNVNSLVEMMDMREAQRSFEANLSVIDSSRQMLTRTIDLLRA